MEHRRRLQEEVRRQQQKRVMAQRIIWSIIAIAAAIGAVFGLFAWQDYATRPERFAREFMMSAKGRDSLKATGYQEHIGGTLGKSRIPSFYSVDVVDKKVNEARGPEKEIEVDVVIHMRGEQVAGTEGAIARKEKGQKGPTHDIFVRLQKQRDGQIHERGKWKVLALQITPIQ